MFTCTDHDYAIVVETKLLFRTVWVICTKEDCTYETFIGRRLRLWE